MKSLGEKIAIMTAYRNGATIQRRPQGTEHWRHSSWPTWDWGHVDYRVFDSGVNQPVERYALIRGEGCIDEIYFYKEDAHRDCQLKGGRVALLREVLPADAQRCDLMVHVKLDGTQRIVMPMYMNKEDLGHTHRFVKVTS